jgi:hypothetical protein
MPTLKMMDIDVIPMPLLVLEKNRMIFMSRLLKAHYKKAKISVWKVCVMNPLIKPLQGLMRLDYLNFLKQY